MDDRLVPQPGRRVRQPDRVVIRFAEDSGDGMPTGGRFTSRTAPSDNHVSMPPEHLVAIRAPAGTPPRVSSFQVHLTEDEPLAPGDQPDVLVAMTPAALKANIGDLRPGGVLIVDIHGFTARALRRAGYGRDPLTDGSLHAYPVHAVDLTRLAGEAVAEYGMSHSDATRAFALGWVSWMYNQPTGPTIPFLQKRFADRPAVQAGQVAALRAGWRFGETTTSFAGIHETGPAPLPTGTHRSIRGSLATAYGLLAAAHRAGLPLFLGAYPGTPADEIRHELSKLTSFGVRPFQAEDEIAAAGAALGASFAGMLGATVTSGPGMALNAEMIAFGVSLELPLVVVNVQRGGPSADRSTKSEQADLLQALYGRNGESPVPVIAPRSPSDCFDTALEACRIALAYRTPVVLLSDTGLAHGCEPWRVPDVNRLPDLAVEFATAANGLDETGREVFLPYARDPRTLARPLGLPGTPGLQHRIGGLEEAGHGGGASGGPDHHDLMARTRQAKIDKIAVPALSVDDPSAPPGHGADILVLGWGSTYGPISAACRRVRRHGAAVAQAHLRHINPLPPNTASVLSAYETVLVPEMNTGQLASLLRASCLVDTISHTPTGGLPFHAAELEEVIMNVITGGTFS